MPCSLLTHFLPYPITIVLPRDDCGSSTNKEREGRKGEKAFFVGCEQPAGGTEETVCFPPTDPMVTHTSVQGEWTGCDGLTWHCLAVA